MNDYYDKKSDQGKIDWSLLPWRAIESAAKIMTIAITPKEQGGKGYGLASWRDVPEGFFRYQAAMIRHFIARFVYGEVIDPESGEPHMGHVICNAAFVFEKDKEFEEMGSIDESFYCRQDKNKEIVLGIKQQQEQIKIIWNSDQKMFLPTNNLICKHCGVRYEDHIISSLPCSELHHVWV